MTILNVPEMHCNKCVERITKALTQDGLEFTVSLENHRVEIQGSQAAVDQAIATLDDLGFTATPA